MKKIVRYIISYGSAVIFSLVGLILQMFIPQNVFIAVLAIISVIPIVLLVCNMVLAKKYVSKINKTKLADMHGYMLRHRKEAQETSHLLLKKLQRIRHITSMYSVIIWLLAVCIAVLGGILYHFQTWLFYLGLIYSGTVFYAVYSRYHKEEKIVLDEDDFYLSREEYPYITSLVHRAANTLGCNSSITVMLTDGCNATIIKDKDRYILQIGIILLGVMSEDELYCIFLHEFSHVSDKNAKNIKEARYNAWISNQGQYHTRIMSFLTNLYVYFDVRYIFDHMTFQYATAVVEEVQADRDIAKYGDAKMAASAFLKLNYSNNCYWESGVKDEDSIYQSETLKADYFTVNIQKLKKAIETRHDYWDSLVDKEILANNATHPTLKMRLETLGIKDAKLIDDDSSQEYREEVQKAIDYAESKVYENRRKTYEQDRKECYTEPLKRVSEWEINGCPIVSESYADIISDLKQLGRHEEAEALCDRAINELNENSSMHAYFIKGCALLYRYDDSGLDYIYHAIEKNQNYLEEGLQIIGTFCCMTGREKELLEYRDRAPQLAQKNKDENSKADYLSKNDNLTKENLPDGMLEDILTFIKSVDKDIIQNIYLVRKNISDTFFTSAFVIHFYGGTDAQRDEIMHKIFRYLDSYPTEWQFSLFDYFECMEIKFDRIDGSLVYSKSNKNI